MKTEHIDDLADSLFRAAREERPRPEAKNRTLELLATRTRSHSKRRAFVIGAGVLALAAGIALFATRPKSKEAEPLGLRAEPTRPLQDQQPSAPPASARAPSPAPSPVVTSRNSTPPAPSAAKPRLADELRVLESARTELRAGHSDAALRTLDDYARNMRGGLMAAEATLLRIEGLSRAGRASEADALARRFVEANPHSALADRARQFIQTDTGDEP